ncbi:MAG: 4Fe-4S binding protein [Deltaproteobacteria bacterium]|nr:4Fe-4S binding protein [Deltaproteobacteria bacterium]
MLFLIIVCFIGLKFGWFEGRLEKGILPLVDRPPGVEAFLPISALVSLKYFFLTGTINDVHPSGLVIFLIICATAFIVKKGFCSWVCPIGFLSEYLSKVHYLVFKKGYKPSPLLDRTLRICKYLLAGFFIWSVFFKMPLGTIESFIKSPYNILADIKMFRFFTRISMTAFFVILGLILLSVLIRNFWCRYLCPYGALIGVLSLLSLGRINFNRSRCSNCGKCEKACPGLIKIRQGKSSFSFECSACLQCVNVCPEKNALKYSFFKKIPIGSVGIGMILLVMFSFGIATARLTGHWENKISKKAYFFNMMAQGMMDRVEIGTGQSENLRSKRMLNLMKIMQGKKN